MFIGVIHSLRCLKVNLSFVGNASITSANVARWQNIAEYQRLFGFIGQGCVVMNDLIDEKQHKLDLFALAGSFERKPIAEGLGDELFAQEGFHSMFVKHYIRKDELS